MQNKSDETSDFLQILQPLLYADKSGKFFIILHVCWLAHGRLHSPAGNQRWTYF